MNRKNIRDILFLTLCFVFVLGIIFIPGFKKVYKSNKYNNYSTTQVVEFEKRLFGATGWAAVDLNLKTSADVNSANVAENNESIVVHEGDTFIILGESGEFWQIQYGQYYGYIESKYCMINLPDVIPSIKYNIVNASGSIYKSKGNDIPNVTGEVLYGTDCVDGICQKLNGTGKTENVRIGRNEYIVPAMYTTAKKIGKVESLIKEQNSANNRDWSLMIYDSYRPVSVSQKVSQEFEAMLTPGSDIYNGISNWCYPLNADDPNCRTYFIANVTSGHVSSHNQGVAVDVSLWDNNVGSEVAGGPTAVHELSEDAARCSTRVTSSEVNNCTFSTGMNNSQMAQYLASVMTNENVGMRPIASEWWHFQDDNTLNLMNAKTSTTGRNFQATNIVSTYGFPKTFTNLVGDVNADGSVDVADAELIYNTYELLEKCDTCDDIKSQADYSQDGKVDLDDVYDILNRNDDLLTSNDYTIGDDYIFVGLGTFDSSLIEFNGSEDSGVTYTFNSANSQFIIKLNDNKIRTYYVVGYSYTGNALDLSKSYIFLEGGMSQLLSELSSNRLTCTNCAITYTESKLHFKRNIDDEQGLATYDLVYYTSDYSLDEGLNIYHTTVENLLSRFQCYNCVVEVYNDSDKISSGNIPDDSQLVIKETISGSGDVITRANINFLINVSGVELDRTSLNLNIGQNRLLTVIVSPSNAANKGVTWSSSDESVATVVDGTVTAVGVGEATITVTTEDGGYTDTCSVVVSESITYDVTFKDGNTVIKTVAYEEGANVSLDLENDNPTKEGYVLLGWRLETQEYSLTSTYTMPSHNVVFAAIWELVIPTMDNKYEVEDNILKKGLDPNTNVNSINLGLSNIYEYTVLDKKGNEKISGKIGTGDKVRIILKNDNTEVVTYIVSIKGDLNGDGDVSSTDFYELYKFRKKIKSGQEVKLAYKFAGDINNDGTISSTDFYNMYTLRRKYKNLSSN